MPARLGELGPNEVHCWRFDSTDFAAEELASVLSEDERRHAERFRIATLRSRYITGRGTLRLLLGRYLKSDPASFTLAYQAHGKPELGPSWRTAGLEFNVSHSHDLALYAFTRGHAIGVDVEHIRPMPNVEGLLERFFSPEEVRQWRQAPAERQLRVFFQGWTRKEAWLKAVGSGLSFPLSDFCVAMDGPARIISVRGDRAEGAAWWLEGFEPCEGYVAAAALRGPVTQLRTWQFSALESRL